MKLYENIVTFFCFSPTGTKKIPHEMCDIFLLQELYCSSDWWSWGGGISGRPLSLDCQNCPLPDKLPLPFCSPPDPNRWFPRRNSPDPDRLPCLPDHIRSLPDSGQPGINEEKWLQDARNIIPAIQPRRMLIERACRFIRKIDKE